MGLTTSSTGRGAIGREWKIDQAGDGRVIALAGNPNVGKSTVFNQLTNLHQHTGNWPGKTVSNARGHYLHHGEKYTLVDIPGTYSLTAHSAEEEVARDFVCFGQPDAVVVVCDATCLERNLNLVLQVMEVTGKVVVCVNLLDEADKKGIRIDFDALGNALGVPVVGTQARGKKGMGRLTDAVAAICTEQREAFSPRYPKQIEQALDALVPLLEEKTAGLVPARWAAVKLLSGEEKLLFTLKERLGADLFTGEIRQACEQEWSKLKEAGIPRERIPDMVAASLVLHAEEVCMQAVTFEKPGYNLRDRKIDRLLTSRTTGIPVMLAMLAGVFWITIVGANVPSQFLSDFLFSIQEKLSMLFDAAGAPAWLHGLLVDGVYRVAAWVISVMLPPMAIFFPLFTLLEDLGYLPRVAFNLDHYFKKCGACGKQALTVCMGFGCNAVGVTGARIIDSPRERLIAVMTNSFVPCNGRFPTLIAMITMFFIAGTGGLATAAWSAGLLTGIVLLGILMTFFNSYLLSKTVLKGVPSSFALELPPYRRPQIGQVIVRSILDRTVFVLGRAAAAAAPAGAIIWLMANIQVDGGSLLAHCAGWLDPFARILGLDGVILIAFILGFPANEIVVPVMMMAYLSAGSLQDSSNLMQMHLLLTQNGWTWLTAVCMMLFSLMHWPCATTCLTIYQETKSIKWTALSILLPTAAGMAVCALTAGLARLAGLA